MAEGPCQYLEQLADVLSRSEEHMLASVVRRAAAQGESALVAFLSSNELWGGAGSIADQACLALGRTPLRRELEGVLIRLGRWQLGAGQVNPRISM